MLAAKTPSGLAACDQNAMLAGQDTILAGLGVILADHYAILACWEAFLTSQDTFLAVQDIILAGQHTNLHGWNPVSPGRLSCRPYTILAGQDVRSWPGAQDAIMPGPKMTKHRRRHFEKRQTLS